MSEHRQEYIDLCAAWALGSLDAADRRTLDQHLAEGCAECAAAMEEFSAATVMVAASAAGALPRPALKDRVLAAAQAAGTGDGSGAWLKAVPGARPAGAAPAPPRAGRGDAPGLRPRPAWTTWLPVAAAAALAVTSGVLWIRARQLGESLASSRKQVAQLEQRMSEEEKWSAVLRATGARVSLLEPTTEGDARLRARATYDPATRRAVVVFENLYKPNDRDYQLWVIKDGVPASLGLIRADEDGRATLRLENVGDSIALSAFAVSLEPKGGSPNPAAPTGPVVMLGKLST